MRILYLDLDALRPDHLGCYGYHRKTSPAIDAIARRGTRFLNYFCSDSPCLPSRTAMMTGRFGIHTGAVSHGGLAADVRLEGAKRGFRSRLDHETVPGLLKSAGFRTASISPFAERHGAWTFNAGFDEIYNTGHQGIESAEEVSPRVHKWLGENAVDDDWFLHVNFWDPHVPYRAPAAFGNPFEDEPLPGWLTDEEILRQQSLVGIQMPVEKGEQLGRYARGGGRDRTVAERYYPPFPRHPEHLNTPDDVRAIIDGYDCGIRYMDSHLQKIFDVLESKGVLEDTLVIISADHGENLGELGIYGDHITADYITHHIPMIMAGPGVSKDCVNEDLHYGLDLAPTLAEIVGRPVPKVWDGKSFAEALAGTVAASSRTERGLGQDPGHRYLVLSQAAGTCQRAVRFGRWHYIRTYHDGYNLFPKEMLFDIVDDPHELRDLAAERSEVCHEAVYRLSQWFDEMMDSMPEGYDVDPMRTVIREGGPSHVRGRLPTYLERLQSRGLDVEAAELRRRHPNEL